MARAAWNSRLDNKRRGRTGDTIAHPQAQSEKRGQLERQLCLKFSKERNFRGYLARLGDGVKVRHLPKPDSLGTLGHYVARLSTKKEERKRIFEIRRTLISTTGANSKSRRKTKRGLAAQRRDATFHQTLDEMRIARRQTGAERGGDAVTTLLDHHSAPHRQPRSSTSTLVPSRPPGSIARQVGALPRTVGGVLPGFVREQGLVLDAGRGKRKGRRK